MKALTYIEHGKFALIDKPRPEILDPRDVIVRVTLGSICIICNLYLIPIYGIFGAATSWIIAQILEILLSGGIVVYKTRSGG